MTSYLIDNIKIQESDGTCDSDIICHMCNTEFCIIPSDKIKGYKNINANTEWLDETHSFFRAYILFPEIIKNHKYLTENLCCPNCDAKGQFGKLALGMLDFKMILQSLLTQCNVCQNFFKDVRIVKSTKDGKFYCLGCLVS